MAEHRFDREAHKYYVGIEEVPSVTRVLEPLQELDGIPRNTLEAARERGQHVHTAIHLVLHKALEWRTLDPQLVGYVQAAQLFIRECEFQVLVNELPMVDEGLKFGGMLDVMGIMRRKQCLVDWKAVDTVSRVVGPQTAAYDYLYRRKTGARPMHRYACQLFADGSYKLFPLEDPRDWSMFASALNIWHWRNGQA
jgi:hypothetical protein